MLYVLQFIFYLFCHYSLFFSFCNLSVYVLSLLFFLVISSDVHYVVSNTCLLLLFELFYMLFFLVPLVFHLGPNLRKRIHQCQEESILRG